MNKSILFFCFIFSLIASSLFAEDIKSEYDIRHISKDLIKDANAIIRDSRTEIMVNDIESATVKVEKTITLLNDNTNYDIIQVYYNRFIKVKNFQASIYDARGKLVKKFKKKDIADLSAVGGGTLHGDSRIKKITAYYGTFPYTIEYAYETERSDTRHFPSWYITPSTHVAVEKSTYILKTPNHLTIRYKAYNHEIEPKIEKSSSTVTYTWQARDFSPISINEFSPSIEEIIPMVKISPTKFSLDGRRGDMSTWESIGEFYYKLNAGRDQLSTLMQNKVKDLVKNATSDEEKIQILYKYLQDNTRYVSIQLGVGGWQTFDAAYVTQNKYGDCKALSKERVRNKCVI